MSRRSKSTATANEAVDAGGDAAQDVGSGNGVARRLIVFALVAIAVHVGLSLPWPGARMAYARAHAAVVTLVFGSFDGGRVRMEARGDQPRRDSRLVQGRPGFTLEYSRGYSAWENGYQPTVMVLALVAATPVPWTRRLRALALGMVLIHGFIGLRVMVAIVAGFAADGSAGADPAWALYHPSPFWRAVLRWLSELLVTSPVLTYVVPILVWAVSVARARDIVALGTRVSDRPVAKPADRS